MFILTHPWEYIDKYASSSSLSALANMDTSTQSLGDDECCSAACVTINNLCDGCGNLLAKDVGFVVGMVKSIMDNTKLSFRNMKVYFIKSLTSTKNSLPLLLHQSFQIPSNKVVFCILIVTHLLYKVSNQFQCIYT